MKRANRKLANLKKRNASWTWKFSRISQRVSFVNMKRNRLFRIGNLWLEFYSYKLLKRDLPSQIVESGDILLKRVHIFDTLSCFQFSDTYFNFVLFSLTGVELPPFRTIFSSASSFLEIYVVVIAVSSTRNSFSSDWPTVSVDVLTRRHCHSASTYDLCACRRSRYLFSIWRMHFRWNTYLVKVIRREIPFRGSLSRSFCCL